ncbi:histone-lysine N-methyltransferase ASHH2 isoform X1 [Iris pallida]|uniref:Histone-lysine N-methyltransferase ASHH2 isoform X1 n=1 Tax=Iris pallida TaxID=29817 RepID=A0AAX6GXJ1_IRIPA|nr:histone-lysine N-methyltransferase ASHH2 isoform X1 [Iris pallida]KAJ6833223.1 histone-lysine N-methyltransferase ASHH2 isoform X1 [Iris pallida]
MYRPLVCKLIPFSQPQCHHHMKSSLDLALYYRLYGRPQVQYPRHVNKLRQRLQS